MGRKMDTDSLLEMGPAVLVTCVVQTLADSDPSFRARFIERLEKASTEMVKDPRVTVHTLEELAWAKQLLTAFMVVKGEEKAFLET